MLWLQLVTVSSEKNTSVQMSTWQNGISIGPESISYAVMIFSGHFLQLMMSGSFNVLKKKKDLWHGTRCSRRRKNKNR